MENTMLEKKKKKEKEKANMGGGGGNAKEPEKEARWEDGEYGGGEECSSARECRREGEMTAKEKRMEEGRLSVVVGERYEE